MSGFRSALALPLFRLGVTPAVFVPPPALSDPGYLARASTEGYLAKLGGHGYKMRPEKMGFLARVAEWFEVSK